MKKVLQIVAACVVFAGLFGLANAPTTGAQAVPSEGDDCDVLIINGTGEGSNNEVVCTVEENVTVVCENGIYVLDENSQTAISGGAVVGGNVTGGTAITGNATNQNGTTVEINSECSAAETPVTPSAPVMPTTPAPSTTPTTPTKVSVLPFTSGNSALDTALVTIIVLTALAATAHIGITAYRRIATQK